MLSAELHRLMAHVVPYRWWLVLVALFMMIESATALAIPWLAGQLTSPLLQTTSALTFSFAPAILALLGLCAVQATCSFGSFYLTLRTAERLVADLRMHIYDHLQALPLDFYHQKRQGDMLALLTRDVDILSWFISGPVLSIAPSLLTFFGAMVLMMRIDFVLGVLIVLSVSLCFLCIKILGRHIRHLSHRVAQEYATAIALVEDFLRLVPIIKAFTCEEQASARYRHQLKRISDLVGRKLYIQSALGPLIQFSTAAGVILLLWLSAQKVVAGTLHLAH